MSRFAGALVVGLMATTPVLADVGLGLSVRSNDTAIYVPIGINEKFFVEPYVRQLHQTIDLKTVAVSAKSDTLMLGIGGFYVKPLADSFHLYFGGRIAYLKQEADSVVITGFFPQTATKSTTRVDGFRVSPTLGIEYAFNDHLSIAGEAEYFFQDTDANRDDTPDQSANGTDTRLLIRFRF